ncbi:terminase family protein [Polyangium sp. 15x6]|uniref:terminase large subunit domain-containing protein n=1 Tax=Polyangium sp. 15x6 TaxID=3042687 RepID=UPI00249BF07F|nr:terminase family protein [Polyangium sp. 15x6]MDI3282125.1 terminase family protein [Polyangium sp. 15x6]
MSDYFVPDHVWQPPGVSKIDTLKKDRTKLRRFYASLSPDEKLALPYLWRLWARPNQLPPPNRIIPHALGWKYWALLAGRGFGKTRTAAEYVRFRVESGLSKRIALIAPTYRDVIQTMLRGESGLLSIFPPQSAIQPRFVRNDSVVYFEKGSKVVAEAHLYTGEEPERLRGPQHDFAWLDEVAAFKYLEDVWLLFVPGHRLGSNPQAIFTTTPKTSLLKINLLENERTVVTFGTSRENAANLAPGTLDTLASIYEDTDLGEQELNGKLRLDDSGALFKFRWVADNRIKGLVKANPSQTVVATATANIPLAKVVVAVDPSGSARDSACECGIIVAGLGLDSNVYILEDLSKRASPDEWARIAIDASAKYGATLVYEANFGGELVRTIIRRVAQDTGKNPKLKDLHAQKDKAQRAMPISAMTQKGRVKFVGEFAKLEKQLTTWTPDDPVSPDRLDAFVWACHDLLMGQSARGVINF